MIPPYSHILIYFLLLLLPPYSPIFIYFRLIIPLYSPILNYFLLLMIPPYSPILIYFLLIIPSFSPILIPPPHSSPLSLSPYYIPAISYPILLTTSHHPPLPVLLLICPNRSYQSHYITNLSFLSLSQLYYIILYQTLSYPTFLSYSIP